MSIFAHDYKMAPQNRTRMNGSLCQSKNSCDDRPSVLNSRREDIITSFGFDGDCVGSSSDGMNVETNVTTTCRMPGMMFGRTVPSTRNSHLSTDSSFQPALSFVPASSGRATGSAFASMDDHLCNTECCDDQCRPNSLFTEAEPRQRNSRTQGYYHQDSGYEEHSSENHNPEERRAQDSRCQGPDFQDCRTQNPRCQDAGLLNQNSRSSYFLNLSAMDRNLGHQNETRKLASTPSKSSSLTSTDQSSRGGALGQTQLPSRNIHRKNLAYDDQSLHNPMANAAFIRGGVRRSLQLPRDRPTTPSRILTGISPLGSEKNRSSRPMNLSNVGTSHNGSMVKSPIGREKSDDKRTDVNGRNLNGTAKTPWPRLGKVIDENKAQGEDDDEGTEDTMKVRFQEIYGTIGRKYKVNQRNTESSSSMQNGFGSLTQSTSLAQLSQKSPTHDLLMRGSVSPMYPRSGADGGADWNDPVYDPRNNLSRVYGSMSPMLTPSAKPKTGIPMLVGQQVKGKHPVIYVYTVHLCNSVGHAFEPRG